MIDLSKITDIAMIMVDASVGFEMNSFEYLCLLKVKLITITLFLESRFY